MKPTNRIRREKKESHILETKADKIIFASAITVYAIVMLTEFKLTPNSNIISSAIAAFGVAAFLISKAIHVYRNRPPVLPGDWVKFLAMPVISLVLIVSGVYWLLSKYVF